MRNATSIEKPKFEYTLLLELYKHENFIFSAFRVWNVILVPGLYSSLLMYFFGVYNFQEPLRDLLGFIYVSKHIKYLLTYIE